MEPSPTLRMTKAATERRAGRSGFTLVELLVVVAIIGLLLSVLMPALGEARQQARRAVCASNLHQVGVAISLYANDNRGHIPFGPKGLPVTPTCFYTVTGDVTSLLSLESGDPVGLGLLLKDYLAQAPEVLFCPGADQPSEAQKQLKKVGHAQAQSDYFYRHASVALITGTPTEFHTLLSNLGRNSDGFKISALVTDVQFMAHPSLAAFGVLTRTSHQRRISNFLFADGSTACLPNTDEIYTVDIGAHPYDALTKILRVFEIADARH